MRLHTPSQYVEAMGNPKLVLDHEPEAVTYARKKAQLSKTDVARELGVSLSLISMIETGDRNATPAMILRLAGIFNCPVVILERKRYTTVLASDGAAVSAA